MSVPSSKAAFAALENGAIFSCLASRTRVELTGEDRHKFLNGLCTNDILKLQPGQGCEAFLTTVQGKTAGYVYIFCEEERLVLDTVADQAESIIGSFDRYLIREDVELRDTSAAWREILIVGSQAASWLAEKMSWPPASGLLEHREFPFAETRISLRTVPYAGRDSFFLATAAEQAEEVARQLQQADFVEAPPEVTELLRIEAGTPEFGRDLDESNLPQEVGRDSQAIHFEKGCYLGQETIARLDALGHVNRLLVAIRLDSDSVPSPGTVLQSEGKPVARVCSACWSPTLDGVLALAYVRRSHMAIGSQFTTELGEAKVIAPPR